MNHSHGLHHSKGGGSSWNGAFDGNTSHTDPYDYTTSVNLRHRHSATFTPSITFNDSETRPINYTIQIWKRIA